MLAQERRTERPLGPLYVYARQRQAHEQMANLGFLNQKLKTTDSEGGRGCGSLLR